MSHPLSLQQFPRRYTPKRVRLGAAVSQSNRTSDHSDRHLEAAAEALKPRFSSPRQSIGTLRIPKTCFMHKSHRAS